ncbi:MAG TPA: hypothetical protein VEI80_04755 [Candidatus Acidoferrales bacterium]|jgi:hypothetical protein|nr:hypothetical protein [Candidatus Acidoferrales bacterium]
MFTVSVTKVPQTTCTTLAAAVPLWKVMYDVAVNVRLSDAHTLDEAELAARTERTETKRKRAVNIFGLEKRKRGASKGGNETIRLVLAP